MHFDFVSKLPMLHRMPYPIPIGIANLLEKGVLVKTIRTGKDHFSNVFYQT